MKEFISGTNWKWSFYTWKDKYALFRNGLHNEYFFEVIPSVFYTIKFYDDKEQPKEISPIDDCLYKKLMDKFFCPLREIDKEDMINIALEVLNKKPRLRCSTLLGWIPFEDKTKDPNYFDGTYIFPDGNEYTITLYKGSLSVYPGEITATTAIWLRLPLISKKINLQQWADKIYKDKDILIEFEEN